MRSALSLAVLSVLAAGCTPAVEGECAVVNDGRHYRFDSDSDRFEVDADATRVFADDTEAALGCGSELAEDWTLRDPQGWPAFFHFDAGDELLTVNDETDPGEMLEQVRMAAAAGGEVRVTYQRGGAESTDVAVFNAQERL